MSLAATRYSAPSGSTISTHSTISPMARPYAPAFIVSAPPTVPGIPPSSSAPEREDRAHRTANLGSITPASAAPASRRRPAAPRLLTVVNPRTLAPTPSSTLPILPPRRPCLSRPSGGYHALCQFPYISGPHGQKYVARLQPGENPPCGFPCLPRDKDRLVPAVPDRLAEPLPRGPRGPLSPPG